MKKIYTIICLFSFIALSTIKAQVNVPQSGSTAYTLCTSTYTVYSPGGTGAYPASCSGYTTFYPTTGGTLSISLTQVVEAGYDYFSLYRGVGTGGTLLYGGVKGTGTACTSFSSGSFTLNLNEAVTIYFYADGSNQCSGSVVSLTQTIDLGLESAAITAASACNNGSVPLGAGAYKDVTVAAGTYYNFTAPGTITNGDAMVIRPLNGSGSTGTVTLTAGQSSNNWFSGTTTSVRVTNRRSNCTWAATSSALTYRNTQPAAVGISAAATICSGSSTNVTASGGTYGTMYWQGTTASGTSTATASSSQSVSTAGTYYYSANNNGCWTYSSGSAVSVLPAVSYGTVASANQTICYNTIPSSMSVSGATGSGSFTYQWYSQAGVVAAPTGSSLTGWTSLGATDGANTATYTPASGITSSTTYACFVTPGGSPTCGTGTWASSARQVTVLPALNYGTVASANQTICYNATPSSMSVSGATGSTSFTYQWYSQAGIVAAPTGSSLTGWTSLGATGAANTATYTPASGITSSTTYACFVTPGGSPTCGTGTWASSARQVTVLPTVSYGSVASGNETICNNGTPSAMSVSGATGSTSFTYQWYSQANIVAAPTGSSLTGWTSLGATNGANTATYTPASGIASSTTYACFVTPGGSPTCGTGTWASSARQVTVLPTVSYGTVASANQTICNNSTPSSMSVSGATGSTSFTYQWYSQSGIVSAPSGTSTAGWTTLGATNGANTATYTPASGISSSTTYACFVTPGGSPTCGTGTWASSARQVTVLPTVSYGTVASGNETICNNSTPSSMSVSGATGSTSFTYQWYSQSGIITAPTGSSLTGWTSLGATNGANTATYTPAAGISTSTTYACFVTPGGSPTCGTGTWATSARQVTVRPAFSGGTIASATQTICYNTAPADITYSVAPSGGSTPQYQWYYQTGTITAPSGAFAIGSWTAIGTASTSTPTLAGATIGSLTTTTTFALRITDVGSPACIDNWVGNRQVVTVRSVFSSGTILSTGQTICNGGTPTIIGNSVTPTGGDASYTYSWRSSADGYTSAIALATASTYTPPSGLTTTTSYRRYVNDGTCNTSPTVSTGTWTVTVQGVPTAGTIGSDQTICNGATPSGLTSSSAGTGDGTISYRWEKSTTSSSSGFTTISLATLDTYSPSTLTATTWYRRYTVSTLSSVGCESVASNAITITVQSAVTAGTIGTAQTICNGSTPSGLTSISDGTASGSIAYRWQNSTTSASAGFSDISGEITSIYSPGALTADNWYRRYTQSTQNGVTCESAASAVIKITVQSVPTAGVIGSNRVVCYNTAPTAFTNTTPGSGTSGAAISYRWESSTTSSSAGFSSIGGATSATYTSGALTADTWFRRITISSLNGNDCESAPTTSIKVTVQSVPTAGTIGSDQTICNGTSPSTITSSSVGTGDGTISYRWESSTTSSSTGFGSIAGTSANVSPSALTATTWFRRITVSTLTGTACESAAATAVQITVQSVPTAGVIGTNQTLCNSTSPSALTNTTSGTGDGTISYRWESSTTSSSAGYSTIGGEVTSSYSPGALTSTTWYRRYTVSTLNGTDCESVATSAVQITVQSAPTAGSIGSDQTICYNVSPSGLTSTSVGTGDGTISYLWEISTTSSSTGFSTVPSASLSSYSPGALTTNTWFRRSTISTVNGVDCQSVPTTSIQITVRPNFTPGSISTTGETLCSNIDPSNISNASLASGGDNSITYEWRANGTPIASTNSSSYDPSGLSSTTTFTRWAKDATCNTSFTQSTGSWIVTINNPTVVTTLANNDFVWSGSTSSDWATTSNWLQWNSSSSSYNVPSGYPNSSSANVILPATGACVVNSAVSNGNSLSVNNLTIESGHTFALNDASAILNVNGSLVNNGTWTTPTSGSTVNFNGSGSQTIPVLAYYNLNTSTGGTKTLGGNITASGIVTIGASTTLNLSSYNLTLPYVGAPLVKTGSFSASTGTVIYNGAGTQTVTGTTYYNLTTSGSGSKNLGASTIISNALDLTAGTLTIGANTLTINGSSISRTSGSIDASNASSTLVFGNSSALTLPSSIFSAAIQNLTLSGNRVKASSDFTVNGTLNLNNSNPDATNGLLDLVQSYGSYADVHSVNSTDSYNNLNSVILTLGSSATTTGAGDVTGKIRRTSFSDGVTYTFGNANMQITFQQNAGTLPTQMTVVSTKGTEGIHVDKDGTSDFTPGTSDTLIGGAAVKRMHQILRTGGTSGVKFTVRFPYEDSDLNGNTEADLVTWDHHLPYGGLTPHEHGKTSQSTTSNYVELANHGINYLATEGDATFTKYWMISKKITKDTLWLGAAGGTTGTQWNTGINWSSGAVPSNWTKIVVDPIVYNSQLSLTGSHQAATILIKPNGIVNGGSGTLTLNGGPAINGGAGTWVNTGTFNAGTSTIVINNDDATMAGNTKFYNLTINSGKKLTMQASAVDTIMNELIVDGTLDATSNNNTVVFGGEYQVIPVTNYTTPGYYNLVIDQTSGASATSADVLSVKGNLTVQNGTLDMYSNNLEVKGDLINNGSITSSPTITLNGTGAQSIEGSSVITFNNLNIEGASGTVTTNQDINVEGTLTVDAAKTLAGGASVIELRSGGTPFISDGTFNANTSTVRYVSTDITDITGVTYNNLISTGNTTKSLVGNTTVLNDLSVDESLIALSTHKLTTKGLTTSNSGKLDVTSGELELTNTSTVNLASDVFETSTVNIMTLSGASDVSLGGDLTITGELKLPEGTLKLGANKLTIDSDASMSKTNGWLNPETAGSILYKADTLPTAIMPSQVVPNLEIDRAGGTVVLTGNLEINGDFKMSNGTIDISSNTLKLSGNMIHISGAIDADNGTVDFNNSSVWNLPTGFFTGDAKGLTVTGAGGLGLADNTRITNTLSLNGGNVTLGTGKTLEIGSSKTNVGSVAWTSGTVVGPMKRWFAASTNSSQESGIFPVGTSALNRYAQINFTSAPEGGYLVVNFHEGLAPDSYATFPIHYTDPSSPGNYFIQNADELGYWEMTPYSESGVAYGALDNTAYDLYLRLNNPYSISHGGVLSDPPRLRLIRAKGNVDGSHGDWTLAGNHEVIQAFTAGEDYKVGSGGVVGFSWFNGGGDNANPLPVELLSFTGNCSDDKTKLTWQTASEFNSAYFEVQSSRDGENWLVVNTQPSAGTSFEKLSYSFETETPTEELYYRLRQVDLNGMEKMYDPIVVGCDDDNSHSFKTFPNPSDNNFKVVLNNKQLVGKATLRIVDTKGTVVTVKEVNVQDGTNMFFINENVAPGIYYISISNESTSTEVIKHSIR